MFALAAPLTESWGGIAITAFQLIMTATSYFIESSEKGTTQVSKFAPRAKGQGVPTRLGMLVMYVPALLVSVLVSPELELRLLAAPGGLPLVAQCLAAHFAKRVLEVLFVHKYSGTVGGIAGLIGVYYAATSVLIIASAAEPPGPQRALGLAMIVVGQLGNLYHHALLASLRTQEGDSAGYTAPRGGLFEYVAAPHYLFELVAWFGVGLVAAQWNCVLVACSMTSFLGGRAVAQNRWNRRTFKEAWPPSRRNLVPFVF